MIEKLATFPLVSRLFKRSKLLMKLIFLDNLSLDIIVLTQNPNSEITTIFTLKIGRVVQKSKVGKKLIVAEELCFF